MERDQVLRGLEQEVGVLIRRVKHVIGQRAHAVHPELQPSSYLMLAYVAENGPVRASVMADLFTLDKGAVSRQVTHLLQLGLLEGSKDPDDGRATLLEVSDDAVRRLADIKAHRRKLIDEQLGDWSDAELEDFVARLGRYNQALNEI